MREEKYFLSFLLQLIPKETINKLVTEEGEEYRLKPGSYGYNYPDDSRLYTLSKPKGFMTGKHIAHITPPENQTLRKFLEERYMYFGISVTFCDVS